MHRQAYFYKYLSEKDIHDKFKGEIEAAQVAKGRGRYSLACGHLPDWRRSP